MATEPPSPEPKHTPRPADVPVFNCHIYLSSPDGQGTITARAASLADLTAEGRNEREALRKIVERFKATFSRHLSRGEPIPWLSDASPIKAGETQRFVPVHM